jgi:hypothetical protein
LPHAHPRVFNATPGSFLGRFGFHLEILSP